MPNRTPTTGSPQAPARASASRVLDAVRLVETWIDRAHQRRALRSLPDYLMHDVAISQADVEAEAGKPFWRA